MAAAEGELAADRQQVAALRGALAQIERIANGQLRRSEPIAKLAQDLEIARASLAETRQDLADAESRELEARATTVELSQALAVQRGRADGAYARGCAEERVAIVQGIADALGPCGRDPRLDSYRAGLRDALEMIRIRGEQG